MERAGGADEVVAAGRQDRHLEAALDRLGAGVGEEGELQVAGRDQRDEVREIGAQRIDQLLRVDRLAVELVAHRLHHPRMAVADDVDAVAAEDVDELLAVDVAEDGALVLPLDRGVVGRDRLAELQEALVDVVGPVAHRLLDDARLLGRRERLLRDQVEDVGGLARARLRF